MKNLDPWLHEGANLQAGRTSRLSYRFRSMAPRGSQHSLLSDIDLAHRIFGIDGRRIDRWVGQVTHEQILIRNWREADAERYKSMRSGIKV